MKIWRSTSRFVLTTLLAGLLAGSAVADVIVTTQDREIVGRITSETRDYVTIFTEDYGELRFSKTMLKTIRRGTDVVEDQVGGFGSGAGTVADPFGSSGSDSSTDGHPPIARGFGIPARLWSPPETNPPALMAVATPQRKGAPAAPVMGFGGARQTPAPIADVAARSGPPRPALPDGVDAMLFGFGEGQLTAIRYERDEMWSRVRKETPLAAGALIQTPRTNGILMAVGAGSELRLAQDTSLQISGLGGNARTEFFLARGAIWGDIPGDGSTGTFEVKTIEASITSPEGTFRVDRAEVGGTRLTVLDGSATIAARSTGVYAKLGQGQQVVVNSQGQIGDISSGTRTLWSDWEGWKSSTSSESGFAPVLQLSQEIQLANDAWETQLRADVENTATKEYQDKLEGYSRAFVNFARDTGHVPTVEEGWSVLKFNPGLEGWRGPYVDGAIPPVDPWRRPLIYKLLDSRSGKVYGRVYSIWQDGIDQGGENSSADRVALILFP